MRNGRFNIELTFFVVLLLLMIGCAREQECEDFPTVIEGHTQNCDSIVESL